MPLKTIKDRISAGIQKIPVKREHLELLLVAAFMIAMIFVMHPSTRVWE